MTPNIMTVLDIGTTKITCLHVAIDDSAVGFSVLAHSVQSCHGLQRGVIVDINETVRAIRHVIQDVETQMSAKIREVYVGISGHHVTAISSNGIVGIRNREVTALDIERVTEAAKAIAVPDNQTILHVMPQEFIVDDQAGVIKPIGMNGVRLEARVLVVLAARAAIQNVIKCVESCGLRVQRILVQPLATSNAVLSKDEQSLGVCLLDIGGGTTDISIWKQQSLRYVSSVPIAGMHVTNDIAVALSTPPKSAEAIKLEHGCIRQTGQENITSLKVETLSNQSVRKVSARLLGEVVEARYHEIFTYVARDLQAKQYLSMIPGGIVLTGGAAKLPGLVAYAEQLLGCQVRLGQLQIELGDAQLPDTEFTAAIGLVLQALSERDKLNYNRKGPVGKLWRRLQHWLEYHL